MAEGDTDVKGSSTGSGLPEAPVDALDHALLLGRVEEALLGRSEPTRIDRFVIDRKLGTGGMGTVYGAWDEQLQRRVALKFLRRDADDEHAESRLHREAQGLARIAHPNVVTVYDVGRHRGRVWIAMEHVPGVTLRDWAQQGTHRRAEIVERWRAAGRGLAAIHEAGLVHRDIKPSNVLLGEDGRVRVIDFGLVRAAGSSAPSSPESARTSGSWSELTRDDQVVGTVAYAAPEQLLHGQADPRSDQYSLCVSLWEALCGERPPRREREQGSLVPLPAGVRLPRRLHRALSRGLATAPEDRFADLPHLLTALAPPRRWPWVVALAGSTAVAGLGVGLSLAEPEPVPAEEPCTHAADPIEAVWSDTARQAVASSISGAAARRGIEAIDGFETRWKEAAVRSCQEVHLHHRRSRASLDRRSLCLDRRLGDLRALVDAAREGALDRPDALARGLHTLDDPHTCLGEAVLASGHAAPPPEQREEIEAVRTNLGRARLGLGLSLEARASEAEQAFARAEAIGFDPLRAEAALTAGTLHLGLGDVERARARLGLALDLAETAQEAELTADTWSALIKLERDQTFDAARVRWAWERRAAVLGRHDSPPRQRGRLAIERGLWHRMEGRYDEAEAAYREGIALLAEAGPLAAWEHAAAQRDLGNLLSTTGRHDEALEHFARARDLELGETDRGRNNETLTRFNEGIALLQAGELTQAEHAMQAALSLAEVEHGPRSAQVVHVLVGLAAVFDARGDLPAAREHAERARALAVAALGAQHPFRADVLAAVGTIAVREERGEDAVRAFSAELAVLEQQSSAEPLDLATARSNLGDALHAVGRDERARVLLADALTTMESILGPDHERLVHPLKGLAAVQLARGDPEAARAGLERALAIHEQHPGQPLERAEALWLLAQALRAQHPEQARVAAQRALEAYRALGPSWAARSAEIEAWLADFR